MQTDRRKFGRPGAFTINGYDAMNGMKTAGGFTKAGAAFFLVALTLALSPGALASDPAATVAVLVDPPASGEALARYLAGASNGDPWSEPNAVLMEIDAALPELAE